MHANCNSLIQPAYRVYYHKPKKKNPYSTIKLIVSSPFFPLQAAFLLLFTSLLKGACTAEVHSDGVGGQKKDKRGKEGAVNTHFCQDMPGEKRAKRQKEQMDGDGANAERECDSL